MSETAARAAATQGPTRSAYVNRMFGRIAPRYDLMNTLMTFGQDRRWRRLTARLAAGEGGGLALDIGAGSGELALELAKLGFRTVGMDFCQPMMDVARGKLASRKDLPVYLTAGDALELPFADATFDCMTAGFALRNLADLGRGLREMHRALKGGGRLAVLELTPPRGGVASFVHRIYTHRFVPALGNLVTRDAAAYSYLPQSVDHFPDAEALCQAMLEAGFEKASYSRLGMGMGAIHVAEKTR